MFAEQVPLSGCRRLRATVVFLSSFVVLTMVLGGTATAELIGHWTLDDGLTDPSADIAVDSSGNGFDGELTDFMFDPRWLGQSESTYGGSIDMGAELGGIVVDMGGELPFGADPRTVMAWINVEFAAQAFFVSQGAGGNGGQFSISVELNAETPNVRLRHGGGSIWYPDVPVVEGEWTHVAAVVPEEAEFTSDVLVYINGEESMGERASGQDRDLNTAESVFVIGGKWDLAENRAFEGKIDDVWYFNEALDQATIQSIMSGGGQGAVPLQAGDADMDLDFDQLDLVKVQVAAKYLTGLPATWGEGDWDGAPGGSTGNPPAGDGLFNQLDIIAALGTGNYLAGPYGAISGGGGWGDGQTSVGYRPNTGEVWLDAPASTELTSINIDSAAGIFTGEPAQNLGGSFDNHEPNNIFKATFGGSFGSISFGNVAQTGLSEDFILNDLTVVGSLAGGGDLGDVDLCCVPEPSTVVLLSINIAALCACARRWA